MQSTMKGTLLLLMMLDTVIASGESLVMMMNRRRSNWLTTSPPRSYHSGHVVKIKKEGHADKCAVVIETG